MIQSDRLLHPTQELSTYGSAELLAIAKDLTPSARSWPGMAQPTRRTWDLMAASDGFEAWVISWPPGGNIQLHDHGESAAVVVVASGLLMETTLAELDSGGIDIKTTVLTSGHSVTVAPYRVHDVANLGAVPAISVHVYAPRLTAMTYYHVMGGHLQANHTVSYAPGEAMP